MIKIEKNIPLPKGKSTKPRKYPFPDMEVGDSFFVECENGRASKLANVIRGGARHWSIRQNPIPAFTTRVEQGGVRVWRIK